MQELAAVILAADEDQRTILRMLVENTAVARVAQTFSGFPVAASDAMVRRIQDGAPDVLLVDIPGQNAAPALHAIELLHLEMPRMPIFAIGDMRQPQVIVNAMRAGAREFLERPLTTTNLLEAFVRFTSAQRKRGEGGRRGKVFTVLNSKGGSGATTVAVNTALTLQQLQGSVAVVDVAALGHAAIHLNLKPSFTIVDALRNLDRLDDSLLSGFMTRHESGLSLLAGCVHPAGADGSMQSDFARLLDMLVTRYGCVVVDASSRIDLVTRVMCDISDNVLLVAQADVASLWSAARVQEYLGQGISRDRMGIVLNRFRRISGFSDADVESSTGLRVLGRVPNHYPLVSSAIDRGMPVAQQNHSEIARAFAALAAALVPSAEPEKRKGWSLLRLG